MPIRFGTYGPFKLRRKHGVVTQADLDEMWSGERVSVLNLERAIGIYIVVIAKKSGRLEPWYVGRTDKGFKRRFNQHFQGKRMFERIAELKKSGPLQVFLLPRLTSVGNLARKKKVPGQKVAGTHRKTKPLKSIEVLEFDLIRECLGVNPHLVNKSHKTFLRD